MAQQGSDGQRPNPLRDAMREDRELEASARHLRAMEKDGTATQAAEPAETTNDDNRNRGTVPGEPSGEPEASEAAQGDEAKEAETRDKKRTHRRKKRVKWSEIEDDGRVIADMTVDGMPDSLTDHLLGKKRPRTPKLDEEGRPIPPPEPVELTKDERREIRRGVIKANLILLVVVLAVMGLLFVLLTLWLK